MPQTDLLLYGAGGHARVVYDALQSNDPDVRVVVLDDNAGRFKENFAGHRIQLPPKDWATLPGTAHIGIGQNAARENIAGRLLEMRKRLLTVIHPRAIVSASSNIDDGVFIAAGAIVGPEARLGGGVIINHGAIVDHGCRIAAFAHIAPNSTLGGGVGIGKGVLIGAGAVVLPNLEIGDRAVVGAGAVVCRNVGPDETVMGIPASAAR